MVNRRSRTRPKRGSAAPERSKKRREVLAVVFALLGVLLLLALVSYQPTDPSLMRRMAGGGSEVANWIGPFGANLSALLLELLGIAAFLAPALLLFAALRNFRGDDSARTVGRGFGALLLLIAMPGLLQLTLQSLTWRGEPLAAGGALGRLLSNWLTAHLGFAGALLTLLAVVIIGAVLLVQSTLGEMLAGWRDRVANGWSDARLGRQRRRERRRKERSRQRVLAKHLTRMEGRGGGSSRESGETLRLPVRVRRREGKGGFHIRRVSLDQIEPVAAPRGKAKISKRRPARKQQEEPQRQIPFPKTTGGRANLPPLNLLQLDGVQHAVEEDELVQLGELIRGRCAEFGVEGSIEGISPGPVVTVFEFQPAPGVKVSQIVGLQDDLALALRAEAVRIARLPGRSTLGIEVPSEDRALIHLGHLLAQDDFRHAESRLTLAIGLDLHGAPVYADLATMPHLLVAGATGSGKSVGLQSMITSILYRATREEVQFIFIDPKRIELGVYGDIPHLKAEVVVEPKKAANALRWAVREMERRYRLLAEVHVRSIDYYNRAILDPEVQKRLALSDEEEADENEITREDLKPLPKYVIVIDELADLMLVAQAEVEAAVARLAQMARAVGIHLIVATQRPSVDVLTGTIKANFPCRIAYHTVSGADSRTILDQGGAERLLGDGDMLYMAPGTSRMKRLHGPFVSEQETAALVRWLKRQGKPELDPEVLEAPEEDRAAGGAGDLDDELFDEAARLVVSEGQGSASFLQRRMRIGFSRASRLIDMMEQDGLVGPPQGSKPRDVLVAPDYFEEIDAAR